MTRVQVIERDGKPSFYVVPAEIWARVRELIEDAEDAADFERAKAEDDGFAIPLAVVKATALDGTHPLRAWREHRGLTVQALADAAGLSRAYLSQIEGGHRKGTAAALRKLARALDVPTDALIVEDAAPTAAARQRGRKGER